MTLIEELQNFASKLKFEETMGAMSVALVVTDRASEMEFPLDPLDFKADGGGQVKGLSGTRVKKILARNGFSGHGTSEGGRTNRGSIANMEKYIAFLNALPQPIDFGKAEQWWTGRIQAYYDSLPLKLRFDASRTISHALEALFEEAQKRQLKAGGRMIVGPVFQHLVGAKLELLYPDATINHQGASVADAPTNRHADFDLNNMAIHVTKSPSTNLVEKCQGNISAGMHPVVISTDRGIAGFENELEDQGIGDRVELLEIKRFLVGTSWNGADLNTIMSGRKLHG